MCALVLESLISATFTLKFRSPKNYIMSFIYECYDQLWLGGRVFYTSELQSYLTAVTLSRNSLLLYQ